MDFFKSFFKVTAKIKFAFFCPRFSDGAATNWYFQDICSSQNPKKISRPVEATFFGRIFFGFMQIRSLSSELEGCQEPRCGGGVPLSEFSDLSKLSVNLTKCLVQYN